MRGSIRKRGVNSWEIKIELERINGKRHRRFLTVKGTYKDAQKELTRLLSSADDGTLPDPTRMTVGEYLRAYLDSALSLSPKTLERYRELAERQVIPHVGEIKLQKLRPEQIEQWHAALLAGGLAAQTVGHAHRVLSSVLKRAVENGTLARNVAAIRKPPKVEQEEIEILSADQISAILDGLAGHALHPIAALAVSSGLRRGELLRLQGRRNITLPPEAVAILRAHRKWQIELRLALGQGGQPSLVFSTIGGGLLSPNGISRSWRQTCAARKLPRVQFHALRHTHASTLIRAGVDVLTISRRLGHSSASMTLDVYGHLMEGADAAAAKAIEGMLK